MPSASSTGAAEDRQARDVRRARHEDLSLSSSDPEVLTAIRAELGSEWSSESNLTVRMCSAPESSGVKGMFDCSQGGRSDQSEKERREKERENREWAGPIYIGLGPSRPAPYMLQMVQVPVMGNSGPSVCPSLPRHGSDSH